MEERKGRGAGQATGSGRETGEKTLREEMGAPGKQSEDSWTLVSGSSVTMAESESKIILDK